MMLKNQLPDNVNLVWEDFNDELPEHVKDFMDESDKWCLIEDLGRLDKRVKRDRRDLLAQGVDAAKVEELLKASCEEYDRVVVGSERWEELCVLFEG